MQKLVFTNGAGKTIDLTAGNFGITNWGGLSNVPLNLQTQRVPFEDGAVFLDALMDQREIELTVAIYDGNNLALRYEKKRELISVLNPKLGEGTLIYTNDYLSKQIKAIPQIPLFENKNSNDRGTLKASVGFSCCSPYWEDVNETVIDLTAGVITEVENAGDVPAQVEIEILGSVKNPRVTNETTEKTVALNGTFAKGIDINTNLGKKQINQNDIEFRWKEGGEFYDCATNGDVTVYVGSQICIQKSDGVIRSIKQSVSDVLLSVTYGNGRFVAVGNNYIVGESLDGENWRFFTWYDNNNSLNKIIYAQNKFVILTATGLIIVTEDLVNYTELSFSAGSGYNIYYINNTFYICGNKLYSSTDLSTFTQLLNKITTSFVYDGEKYYAYCNVSDTTKVNISYDLTNWTESNVLCSRVVYHNGIFVGTRYNNIYTSINGKNFTKKTTFQQEIYYNVKYINNKFVILGNCGKLVESLDGENFNLTDYIIYPYILKDIKKLNNKIYYIYESNNLQNGFCTVKIDNQILNIVYEAITQNFPVIRDIIYKNGFYIIYTYANGIYKSEDGINFVFDSAPFTQTSNVCEGNGILLLGAGKFIYSSIDGLNWSLVYTNETNDIFDTACYGNGKFIFVAGSKFVTSSDGVNFTSTTQAFGLYWRIRFANGLFISAITTETGTGSYGIYICISQNGVNWQRKLVYTKQLSFSPITTNTDVIYYNGVYYLVSYIGVILKSYDLTNWELIQDYNEVASINEIDDILYVGGNNALMLKPEFVKSNAIADLTKDSNMGLNLDIGVNKIKYTYEDGESSAKIKFRQRYVGV